MTTPFPVHAGRGLSFMTLGASLHDILSRLKAQAQLWPKIDLSYSTEHPLASPVIVNLPDNGIRLHFDGPDQRLRLIEVLDFSKSKLSYKDNIIAKLPDGGQLSNVTGPTFKHIYNRLFGPTFPGEYIPPQSSSSSTGTYVMSYPGVAFNFPLHASAWSPNVDFVSLLSSSATAPATSMAIFSGNSWAEARCNLYTQEPGSPRSLALAGRGKDGNPAEIDLAMVHGGGRIELIRRSSPPFWIVFNKTTPQDLVTELGPPDAIYRKNDRRISIHKARTVSGTMQRPRVLSYGGGDGPTDTNRSSSQSEASNSEDEESLASLNDHEPASAECFYNYFHHGFDILISQPTDASPQILTTYPSQSSPRRGSVAKTSPYLTATKMVFHGNIPGSYQFNRHRRSRWTLEHTQPAEWNQRLNSETSFHEISEQLKEVFKGTYASEEEEKAQQRAMILNRGMGNSPSDSCELLGGWEEGFAKDKELGDKAMHGEQPFGNTEIFGFPGLLFEVLQNGAVSCLTVY